ncbi:putative exported protein [hydrothermal vent metagenome]|uniref:Putative exported protein n=1 Tax=hydrothermal vent metagenome TaxID=652676 RepID=A0A1W1C454_9ZZZZ
MKNRRDFLKLSAVTISALAVPSTLFAEESFSDYKALVVIYNAGGNDGFNMFIPSGDDALTGYSNYAKARENIKVANSDLPLTVTNNQLDLTAGNPYALNNELSDSYTKGFYKHIGMDVATNALMPELAHLVNQGKVAVVSNVGNLIEPATKAEFLAKTKVRPPFLFAHNHQTKLAMTGEASLLNYSGWAGRVFDNWIDINGGDIYGMNISVGRSEHLFYGDKTKGLNINSNGPTSYKHIKRDIYDELVQVGESDKFKKLYQELQQHSFEMQDVIVGDWNNNAPTFSSTNAYGGELFSEPTHEQLQESKPTLTDTSIIKRLKAVAKLAYIGKNRGLKRQIFFVYDGGYDTHNNQSIQHARKLRGLSLGIGDFTKALEEMGMANEVTTFNISDFGRSIGENGDGTDHAWGSNLFVVGGAVKGGLYGTLPDLTLGSDDDIAKKGRLIPTTSMSQYYGTIVKWFGADDVLLAKVVPELDNFSVKDLGFMG